MKLTWFAYTTIRIHIGGQILVADAEAAPDFVDRRELISGADRTFALASDSPGLSPLDPARWRPRLAPRAIEGEMTAHEAVRLFSIGRRAVLVDAIGEPPLVLIAASDAPRFGRWADDAVVVLFSDREGLVATGTVLLDIARPRLVALAADEAHIDLAVAELREHLDGAALVSLEPGLALEV
jgi:hypothetical protein